MGQEKIVRGQQVSDQKLALAKELRREMTPAEAALWARLRTNQLNSLHFRRQQIIDGFLADFYCHSAGVVLELDGLIHLKQANYDCERDKVIAAHNLHIERVSNDEILNNMEGLLSKVAALCQSRIKLAK